MITDPQTIGDWAGRSGGWKGLCLALLMHAEDYIEEPTDIALCRLKKTIRFAQAEADLDRLEQE